MKLPRLSEPDTEEEWVMVDGISINTKVTRASGFDLLPAWGQWLAMALIFAMVASAIGLAVFVRTAHAADKTQAEKSKTSGTIPLSNVNAITLPPSKVNLSSDDGGKWALFYSCKSVGKKSTRLFESPTWEIYANKKNCVKRLRQIKKEVEVKDNVCRYICLHGVE